MSHGRGLLGRRGRGPAELAALAWAAARLERDRARMWLSYLLRGYAHNPHEVEARRAVSETR
jgi:hypothetical protein